MRDNSKFSWRKRGLSFKYAWQGMKALIKYEHNSRIHAFFAIAAIACCIIFNVSSVEWCIIIICIGMVLAAEALNSAVEAIADRLTGNYDELIGRAKDFGAFAVTILAAASVVVGLIIFLPKFLAFF